MTKQLVEVRIRVNDLTVIIDNAVMVLSNFFEYANFIA